MEYNRLGSSDLYISRIGFGCMSLPRDEKLSIPILHTALDLGINYLDTADIYDDGINESIIGKAIKGRREKVIIASKAGNQRRSDGGLDWNPSKKHILYSIEESLRRLQTDVIDLYQLHGGTIQDNIDETIETFELLQQQGKIRYYGISSIRPNVIREYTKRSSIVSVMTQYSLLDRRPEEETLDLLHKHNIGVVVRGSVAQGLLMDKPAKNYIEHSRDDVAKAAQTIHQVSNSHRTPAQTALKFVLAQQAVTSVIVGMRTTAQLDDAVKTITAPNLVKEELQLLKDSTAQISYREHR